MPPSERESERVPHVVVVKEAELVRGLDPSIVGYE